VVSYTFTIESTGGSGLVVPGFGFLLNNELTDFNFDSTTHPNRVEGGKRPRSSMAPTIVLRNGSRSSPSARRAARRSSRRSSRSWSTGWIRA
jgi:gamma-glutamyltranspeptidase